MNYLVLLVLVVVVGFAPFYPQPHIVQKMLMLTAGQLRMPIDIFDLLMHGSPFLLLGYRLFRDAKVWLGRRQHVSEEKK